MYLQNLLNVEKFNISFIFSGKFNRCLEIASVDKIIMSFFLTFNVFNLR